MSVDITKTASELAKRFPDRVNPPITAQNEATLKSHGVPIADEVMAILRVFDGEKPAIESILNGARLIPSVGEVGISWYLQLFRGAHGEAALPDEFDFSGWSDSVRKIDFSRRWTPFMDTDNGDVLFVDHDPADTGTDGQVFLMNVAEGCDLVEVIAPSVGDLLANLVARV